MSSSTNDQPKRKTWLERQGVELGAARIAIRIGVTIAFLLVPAIVFRSMFVNYIDNYHLGYKFDARTGEITILPHTGYVVTPPFVVNVHHIDLRPMQVCISAIQRVLNCKLVQFNPELEATKLFLSWHGRQNYDGPDTGSNSGVSGAASYTYFQNVLLNYAYDGSGKNYPFLTILRELGPEEKDKP